MTVLGNQSHRLGFVACTVLLMTPATVHGTSPVVTFDAAAIVECLDVTPDDFRRMHPREKLIEARLQISTLVSGENAADIVELYYRIDSPERSFRIADYFPKTTLTSEYAGNIGFEEKDEQSSNVGLNLAGSYGPLSAANGTASTGDKTANCRRYELLPPLETVAASGTVDRENGVYFKLRPSSRTSVEGAHEVVVILRVPRNWRADFAMMRCQAFKKSRQFPFASADTQLVGNGNFLVGLYASGDEAAQGAVAAFIHTESKLRHVAAAQRSEIERRSAPTPMHELAVQLAVKQPRIPSTWLDQVLVGQDRESVRFLGYLPGSVRESAMDYYAVRRQLRALNAAGVRLPQVESTAGR